MDKSYKYTVCVESQSIPLEKSRLTFPSPTLPALPLFATVRATSRAVAIVSQVTATTVSATTVLTRMIICALAVSLLLTWTSPFRVAGEVMKPPGLTVMLNKSELAGGMVRLVSSRASQPPGPVVLAKLMLSTESSALPRFSTVTGIDAEVPGFSHSAGYVVGSFRTMLILGATIGSTHGRRNHLIGLLVYRFGGP